MALQLELSIKPTVKYTFDNYIVSDDNTQAVSHLRYLIEHPESCYLYLWGEDNIGKSHLLQAMLEQVATTDLTATYFSFKDITTYTNDSELAIDNFLESLESFDIICLDDVQCIAHNKAWQQALFGFYNRTKDASNKILIITGNSSVNSLQIELPDLKSRLAWGISYNIKPLADNDKKVLLQTKAKELGMSLSDELASYLISRGRRDYAGLLEMLDKLDLASLRHKRKLTIPFAKEILGL